MDNEKTKKMIGIVIAILLIGILLPIAMQIFETSGLRCNGSNPDIQMSGNGTMGIYITEDNSTLNIDTFNNSSIEINIDIDNVTRSNETINVEIDTGDISDKTSVYSDFISETFEVVGNCYLDYVQIYVQNLGLGAADSTRLYIGASTWNGTNHVAKYQACNLWYQNYTDAFPDIPVNLSYNWITSNYMHLYLNSSQTDNDTWFFGILDSSSDGDVNWGYVLDSHNGNNADAYIQNPALTGVHVPYPRDYVAKVLVSPIEYYPDTIFIDETEMNINETIVLLVDNCNDSIDIDIYDNWLNFIIDCDITITIDWFNFENFTTSNCEILNDTTSECCINFTIDVFEEYTFYMNISWSESCNLTSAEIYGGVLEYDESDNSIQFELVDGSYTFCWLCLCLSNRISDVISVIPILVVIGIVILLIKQYHDEHE